MEYAMQIIEKEVITLTKPMTDKQKKEFIENLEKQYNGQITLIETFTYTPVNITIQ